MENLLGNIGFNHTVFCVGSSFSLCVWLYFFIYLFTHSMFNPVPISHFLFPQILDLQLHDYILYFNSLLCLSFLLPCLSYVTFCNLLHCIKLIAHMPNSFPLSFICLVSIMVYSWPPYDPSRYRQRSLHSLQSGRLGSNLYIEKLHFLYLYMCFIF